MCLNVIELVFGHFVTSMEQAVFPMRTLLGKHPVVGLDVSRPGVAILVASVLRAV